MPIKMDMSGLEQLQKNIEDLAKTQSFTLGEALNPGFISAHSKFADLSELIAASGFKADTAEDFLAIPDDQWNDYIKGNTDFDGWKEMQEASHVAWLKAKVGKGL